MPAVKNRTECLLVMGLTLTLTVLAVIGMMVVFLGAGGPDSAALLALLLLGSGATLTWLIIAAVRGITIQWWRRLPAWLWVAGLTIWVLAILAFIALVMIENISGIKTPPVDYAPVGAAMIASMAFAIAQAHIAPQKSRRFGAAVPDEPPTYD